MRIVVIDFAAKKGGALSILTQFYDFVLNHEKHHEWFFLLSDVFFKESKHVKIFKINNKIKNIIYRFLFDCFLGRKIINSFKPDVVISLQNTIPFGLNCKKILYVHQAIPFQNQYNFSFFKKGEFKLAFIQKIIGSRIKKSILTSDKIFVQTECMKKNIIKSLKISDKKIFAFLPSTRHFNVANHLFKRSSFFYPTADLKYKNNSFIYNLEKNLIENKISDFNIDITINKKRKNDRSNIHCVGTLSFNEMQFEYNSSTLIFCSGIETIGLPLLEAREANTMILAYDTDFSRECLKNYKNGYFFKNDVELLDLCLKIIRGNLVIQPNSNNCKKDDWKKLYMEIFKE